MKSGFQFSLWILMTILSTGLVAQDSEDISDEQAVYQAVEDYVLALYNVEAHRIERSVDTTLRKIGYYDYNGESYNHVPMSYDELYKLASHWNKKGDQAKSESPKTIEIYEVNTKTASVKLTAQWGIDYMHLSKVDGKWKILNVMWQADPN